MHAVRIGGRSLHVADHGPRDGTAVVFANSLGTDLRVWDPLLPHLPAGLRIVRWDKAGHGLSDLAPHPGIADHAADMDAVFDALGIGHAVVVGLSVGGMIAQAFHAARPERVRALALCDTGHRIGTPDLWNERIAAVRRDGIAVLADSIMQRWFSPAFHRDRADEMALWRNMVVRTPAEGYAAVCEAIRDADLTEAARAIAVPTVCVVGTADGSTPPALVHELAGLIQGATVHEIAGVGHIPPVEAPDALGRILSAFLTENGLV